MYSLDSDENLFSIGVFVDDTYMSIQSIVDVQCGDDRKKIAEHQCVFHLIQSGICLPHLTCMSRSGAVIDHIS
jgi:hypothetical protein